jgi:hypothetical protein
MYNKIYKPTSPPQNVFGPYPTIFFGLLPFSYPFKLTLEVCRLPQLTSTHSRAAKRKKIQKKKKNLKINVAIADL